MAIIMSEITGGLGVDLWAGEILLRIKEKPEYGGIVLHTAIPFPGYVYDSFYGGEKRNPSYHDPSGHRSCHMRI